jgi:hypothetical protein
MEICKKKNRQHNGQKKKDKQRSTKHTYKTKDWVTRTPLKPVGELRCSGRVRSSCSTSEVSMMLLTNFVFLYSHIRNYIIYCFRATRHTWKGSVTMTGRTRTNRNILCNPKRIETSMAVQKNKIRQ